MNTTSAFANAVSMSTRGAQLALDGSGSRRVDAVMVIAIDKRLRRELDCQREFVLGR